MTLSQMVDYVCGKVSQTDTEDQAACRTFLQVRHDNAWTDQLWKDSVYSYSQIITPDDYAVTDTWLPTKQVLLCASEFEHILAVRTSLRTLDIETPETFYRSNFDAFANTGDARQFLDLPRAAWEFDTAQTLYLNNAGATETTVILDTVGADLITKVRTKQVVPSGVTVFGTNPVSRIDGFSKTTPSDGAVSISVSGSGIVTVAVDAGSSGAIDFAWADSADQENAGGRDRVTVGIGQSATMLAQSGLFMVSFDAFGGPSPITGVQVGAAFTGTVTYSEPNVATALMTVASDLLPVITVAAAIATAPLRCRIQPVGTLPNPTTLRILGKAKLGTFEEDNDECLIAGMDKVLLEFGVADMWERERQMGFAQQPFNRGVALLEQLKKVQVCQQAYNKRLIPSGGYGDEWQLNSGINASLF
jgi:hypothetical protein